MSTTPTEPVLTPEQICRAKTWQDEDERFHNALIAFTAAIGNALDVCSYGLTIGEAYVPFDSDAEDECDEDTEDAALCTQAWVRVTDISPTGGVTGFDGSQCDSLLRLGLEVGVLRCMTIEEQGEAPKASDVLVAALQSMDDMRAIYRAATEDPDAAVWDTLLAGQWVPNGPMGGQYGGIWTFTVEI